MSTKNKNSVIQIRIDDTDKKLLEKTLEKLGLTTSQATLMYFKQILLKQKIPMEISTNLHSQDLGKEEFNMAQSKIIDELDSNEIIPSFSTKNSRPFKA